MMEVSVEVVNSNNNNNEGEGHTEEKPGLVDEETSE